MCSLCLGGERYVVELHAAQTVVEKGAQAVGAASLVLQYRHGVHGGILGAVLTLRGHLREPPRVGHAHIGRSLRRRKFERRRASAEEGETEEDSEANANGSSTYNTNADTSASDGEGDDGATSAAAASHVGHPAQLGVHAGPGRGEGNHGTGRQRSRFLVGTASDGAEIAKSVG